MLSVSPSHAFEMGLRNLASRVWPSGNSSRWPSVIQRLYWPRSPRRIGERRYPTTGVAKTTTARPFSTRPILANTSRREISALSSAPFAVTGSSLNEHLQAKMGLPQEPLQLALDAAPQARPRHRKPPDRSLACLRHYS